MPSVSLVKEWLRRSTGVDCEGCGETIYVNDKIADHGIYHKGCEPNADRQPR